ncbi:small ubiquitin-related modifier 3-like [Syzygium oleosum]|uniref:small ubiquitin-related modifier 3-like n=1 Tax=Syzygium oleosum TaxID=219896 RepID=UPI0011D25709|nr:small ubiquitin-related modifier 3-like [Syzygium oleosum]
MDVARMETKPVYLWSGGHENSRPDPVFLRVQNQEEDDVRYLLDWSAPLRALMVEFCARRGFPCDAVRFTYNGARVPEAKSAEDLGMDDGDVMDAWANQLGG